LASTRFALVSISTRPCSALGSSVPEVCCGDDLAVGEDEDMPEADDGQQQERNQVAEPTDPEDELKERYKAAGPTVTASLMHGPPKRPLAEAQSIVGELEAREQPDKWDRYGESGALEQLEGDVAELLGKPAAALFPSGIMAQQSTLRVWTDRRGSKRVALPDLSHLLEHELDGPRLLHGFQYDLLTSGPKAATAADLAAIPGHLGAVLVELPLRDGGYLLPTWDELVALSAACRERGVPLHFDGARIWEAQPYLGHSLADIADLADTVYVSLYKGLGGLAGALVAGPHDVVDEARRWRTRHGGTLVTMMPNAITGLRGLREALPEMGAYYDRALEIAAAFQQAGARVFPDPPQCNGFRIYVPQPVNVLMERIVSTMETEQLELSRPWSPADVPGWSWTEFVVGSATMQWSVDEIAKRVVGDLAG
jgi:threonine aldolase